MEAEGTKKIKLSEGGTAGWGGDNGGAVLFGEEQGEEEEEAEEEVHNRQVSKNRKALKINEI